jgi:hypothetical protein
MVRYVVGQAATVTACHHRMGRHLHTQPAAAHTIAGDLCAHFMPQHEGAASPPRPRKCAMCVQSNTHVSLKGAPNLNVAHMLSHFCV